MYRNLTSFDRKTKQPWIGEREQIKDLGNKDLKDVFCSTSSVARENRAIAVRVRDECRAQWESSGEPGRSGARRKSTDETRGVKT